MKTTRQPKHGVSAIHWDGRNGSLMAGLLLLLMAIAMMAAAQAETFTVLHAFQGYPTDGVDPYYGRLIGDAEGNLYGTTVSGGPSGSGVVYKLGKTGETVVYGFTGGEDGLNPWSGLIRDSAGNLYGTTASGGASGAGVVFKVDTSGNETVLHSFTGRADGANPYATLVRDSSGNLYGATANGGVSNAGVVFELDKTGETVLYSFTGGADGAHPNAGLVRDPAGNLYGTTVSGGPGGPNLGAGVVFKLDKTGTETVLHSFTGGADGASPSATLILDSTGNLYGTATAGGASGAGVVFKLDKTGETVLYSFTGGTDGASPIGGVIRDMTGNLYGTTEFGGVSNYGVVYKLDATGTYTKLYGFTGISDGANPAAGLAQDSAGNLYGTTVFGGTGVGISGSGVVFKLRP